ncbi:sporulation protein [Sodiomyces alkalinus F11]|uniref:Sporulation protein n=1 Tax=Sodiomyces alkalinus (strain CBS 110278 / VKM F-3762 / F11) TaxID=1314773 RepID=A0A3N2Q686_SODAK|nr:sporulation protein [Sodiomyces alkalinus F11]ROT42281.1 sporulation protein [Sodiomyces alkalinus F11]
MAGKTDAKSRDGASKKRKRDLNDKERAADVKRHHKDEKLAKQKASKRDAEEAELKGNALKVLADIKADGGSERVANDAPGGHDNKAPAAQAVGWKLSSPLGGRIADIDPVFSEDESHLILTYQTSIQVYSVADSLLVRKIPLPMIKDGERKPTPLLVATCLSRVEPDFVWVACSDGRIWKINWRHGSRPDDTLHTKSQTALDMCVVPITTNKSAADVLYVSEKRRDAGSISAYCRKNGSHLVSKVLFETQQPDHEIHLLRSTSNGSALVGAHAEGLVVGTIQVGSAKDGLDLESEFYSFETSDIVCTLDVRSSPRKQATSTPKKQSGRVTSEIIDVVTGGARGAMLIYNDLLNKLHNLRGSKSKKEEIQARKVHWHRRAVHTVKWSRDGHYMISGGSENALVLWQVDTAKQNLLPHLPGSIENVTVSPSGSSYAVHLDDNSAMVISTSELKPTTYVSGIQSAARFTTRPKDFVVTRLSEVSREVRKPIPAALNPLDASKFYVCVGTGQQAAMAGSQQSAPILQSFDLSLFRGISKQALARTQPTDVNITTEGHAISEPTITHLAFSSDGSWLATIDDWKPPARDIEKVAADAQEHFMQERREIYLKFWTVSPDDNSLALTSRINSPHSTSRPETVFALAADPQSARFATLGDDGLVRIWHCKTRQRDGLTSTDAKGQTLQSWTCAATTALGSNVGADVLVASDGHPPRSRSGSLSFSEDGSTLFVAFGSRNDGTVFVVDTQSGQVRTTLENLWRGDVRHLRVLSPYIITLSDDLRVYDVVADELQYGIKLPKQEETLSWAGFAHLEVDRRSRTFALVAPGKEGSQMAVLRPEDPRALFMESIPHKITSLVSSPSSSGFVALDDAAQLWSVTESSDQAAVSLSMPLEDLGLDKVSADQTIAHQGIVPLQQEEDGEYEEENSGDEEVAAGDEMDVDDGEDDTHAAVISRQRLAELFDAAPAFAMPSIEDMFYKVTELISAKPLATSSA